MRVDKCEKKSVLNAFVFYSTIHLCTFSIQYVCGKHKQPRRYWNAKSQSKDKHRSNYNDSCDEKAQSNDYNREKSHNRHSLYTPLLCGLGVFCTFSLVVAVDILWLFCIALHWDGKCIKSENKQEDRLNYRGSELAHWESVHCSVFIHRADWNNGAYVVETIPICRY